MLSYVLTQVVFWLCVVVFVRLFTFQRGDARFRRGISCLAVAVMFSAGVTMIHILKGDLVLPEAAWPLVVLLAVFAVSVMRTGGNLAGVLRPESVTYTGPDRRHQNGTGSEGDARQNFR